MVASHSSAHGAPTRWTNLNSGLGPLVVLLLAVAPQTGRALVDLGGDGSGASSQDTLRNHGLVSSIHSFRDRRNKVWVADDFDVVTLTVTADGCLPRRPASRRTVVAVTAEPQSAAPLPRPFLDRPAVEVAPDLLGCVVTAAGVSVRLVEVEAYAGVGADPGSHAHRGRTARNDAMFGPAGTLYVYFTYGMHWCANVVTGAAGEGSAVLLRAGEVVGGLDLARSRRPRSADRDLARGPARLAQSLGLDRAADGTDVLDGTGPVLLTPGVPPDPAVVLAGPRTGVAQGHDTPWRFWLAGERTVSPYRPAVRRNRPSRDGGGSLP